MKAGTWQSLVLASNLFITLTHIARSLDPFVKLGGRPTVPAILAQDFGHNIDQEHDMLNISLYIQ